MQDVPDLRLGVLASGNSNSGMLIDVHAHFYHAGAPRSDWRERNASLLAAGRSEEHTSELQSQSNLVCRLLLEKKKKNKTSQTRYRWTQTKYQAHLHARPTPLAAHTAVM